MTLRGVDLNLLPALRAMLAEGSVTGAAKSLGMSQPAMSNALNRLRVVLRDPLLIRVGRSMRLTPRALEIRGEVERTCRGIEDLLFDKPFQPSTSKRQFVVAMPDYMALILGPPLFDHLASEAPDVSLRVTDGGDDLLGKVASGDIDVAVVARSSGLEKGLRVEGGFADTIVGVVAADHPLAKATPASLADLDEWSWVGAEVWRTMFSSEDPLWSILGRASSQVRLSLSSFLLLPMIVARTGAVTFVPKALADQLASHTPIAQFELPEVTTRIELCQIWSPLLEADVGHRWLRAALGEAMTTNFAPLTFSFATPKSQT